MSWHSIAVIGLCFAAGCRVVTDPQKVAHSRLKYAEEEIMRVRRKQEDAIHLAGIQHNIERHLRQHVSVANAAVVLRRGTQGVNGEERPAVYITVIIQAVGEDAINGSQMAALTREALTANGINPLHMWTPSNVGPAWCITGLTDAALAAPAPLAPKGSAR